MDNLEYDNERDSFERFCKMKTWATSDYIFEYDAKGKYRDKGIELAYEAWNYAYADGVEHSTFLGGTPRIVFEAWCADVMDLSKSTEDEYYFLMRPSDSRQLPQYLSVKMELAYTCYKTAFELGRMGYPAIVKFLKDHKHASTINGGVIPNAMAATGPKEQVPDLPYPYAADGAKVTNVVWNGDELEEGIPFGNLTGSEGEYNVEMGTTKTYMGGGANLQNLPKNPKKEGFVPDEIEPELLTKKLRDWI